MKKLRREMISRRSFFTGMGALVLSPALISGCKHTPAQEPVTHVVEMISEGGEELFRPDRLLIEPGDFVRWVLTSGFHSSTAYHPDLGEKDLRIPHDAPSWDSELIRSDGESFTAEFQTEGTYCYYCTPHEALGMLGVIVVGEIKPGEPGLTPPSDRLPKAAAARIDELIAWAKTSTRSYSASRRS